ncbi:hypothetical protein [Actinomadura alba]|uniref:Uncharacterized protein n=1 Tax=Actinomadura alba TaxID=406431 RepID=A0ABR7LWQ9_9ACTN|nr:hypothetical protein [Actinomadura alba]MBC6468942.1 hypothetical protein [Actinomadura alba]
MTQLTEMSAEHAPRRFSLCLVDREVDDAAVVGWGMAFADGAVAYLPGDPEMGGRRRVMYVPTADRARHRLSRLADVRLIWIDPDPESA